VAAGQWRVERTVHEEFIAEMYRQTEAWVDAHPFTEGEDEDQS
jgi:hypothetical protein